MSGRPDEEITMARTRGAKSADDMLVKSAEFVGWALGGLEREITQTRERLASLNAQAVKLRARIGKAIPTATGDSDEKASRKQRRRQMSREARERISSAMKKRWAERKKARS
jgi:predicted  nucleic acid-binding Zn-ribbon protein